MTPEQPVAKQAGAVLAERDAIQANLLELDGSFVKQVLEGATLTGKTRERWQRASASLAALWETFLAYSAVVDRIAALSSEGGRASKRDLPELTELLSGGCVQLPGAPVSLARRDLAATGRPSVTLRTAVGTMRRAFAEVTEVTSAVEAVWAAVGAPLDAATSELARCRPLLAEAGADIEAEFRAAESALEALRAAANADPLALSLDGRADTAAADRLSAQVVALADRISKRDQVRQQARHRIEDLVSATADARADLQAADAVWQEAATRISGLPPLPLGPPEPPLTSLGALASSGQWSRLAAELDRCEAELASCSAQTAQVRRTAIAAIDKRNELRGLLRAYRAKAARLGAAEDAGLSASHDRAQALLWTAPCDLAAAEAAVAAYQRAILATEGRP